MATTTILGVGLGYREELACYLEPHASEIDFLEIIGDQCFEPSMCNHIEEWTRRLPSVCHFLGLSLGSAEPLDEQYVVMVKDVLERIRPVWFSDHLAISRVKGMDLGHLSPVTFTDETVEIVSRKASDLQTECGLPLLLENITYYFQVPGATLTEWELLTRIVETADCGILLDLNNLYVNARNNGYDAYRYLRSIPLDRVMQVHIGGTTVHDGVLIDSHAHPVPEEVFEYLGYVCRHSPVSAVLLERDRNMPPFEELSLEMRRARGVLRSRAGALQEGA
jgi:uncharacterized protein (UPF0276 family)